MAAAVHLAVGGRRRRLARSLARSLARRAWRQRQQRRRRSARRCRRVSAGTGLASAIRCDLLLVLRRPFLLRLLRPHRCRSRNGMTGVTVAACVAGEPLRTGSGEENSSCSTRATRQSPNGRAGHPKSTPGAAPPTRGRGTASAKRGPRCPKIVRQSTDDKRELPRRSRNRGRPSLVRSPRPRIGTLGGVRVRSLWRWARGGKNERLTGVANSALRRRRSSS